MGVVQKQGIRNTAISFAGAALGFVNRYALIAPFLTTSEIGLTDLLLNVAMIAAIIGSMGTSHITQRFFPYFRNKEKANNGYLSFLLMGNAAGILLVCTGLWLLRPVLQAHYADKTPLFLSHYHLLYPLTAVLVFSGSMDYYLRSLFKTVVPVFLQDFYIKLALSMTILGYVLDWYGFETYLLIYVSAYASIWLVMVIYALYLRQFSLSLRHRFVFRRLAPRMMQYGAFTLLSSMSVLLLEKIDMIMVAGILNESNVGIYTTIMFATSVMLIPYRSLHRISGPKVADMWRHGDIGGIRSLYEKNTMVNQLAGSFLFLGILVNLPQLVTFLKPEFREVAVPIFFFLGIGRLIDMTTSLNTHILITSSRYKVDLVFSVLLVGVGFGLNALLIPDLRLPGAALATGITYAVINLVRVIYIRITMDLWPFTLRNLLVLGIAVAAGLAVWNLPKLPHPLLDIGARSALLSVLFLTPTWYLQLSPDLNGWVLKMLTKSGLVRNK